MHLKNANLCFGLFTAALFLWTSQTVQQTQTKPFIFQTKKTRISFVSTLHNLFHRKNNLVLFQTNIVLSRLTSNYGLFTNTTFCFGPLPTGTLQCSSSITYLKSYIATHSAVNLLHKITAQTLENTALLLHSG